MKYTPPDLPSYLANTFELKPIIGIPTDDEVKAVHAVIRAVETASQIPAWNDPGLSMELAQHLFNVQMARYREQYPVNVLPSANTYNPPTLPSHLNISLEPVTGAPTDGELKLVQTALRASEDLIKLPSVFDPDLSMNLSQHLFDIQFARYIQHTTEGRYTTSNAPPDVKPNLEVLAEGIEDDDTPVDFSLDTESTHAPEHTPDGLFTGSEHDGGPGMTSPRPGSPGQSPKALKPLEHTRNPIEQTKAGHDQPTQLATGIQDTLKDVLMDGLKDVIKNELKDALDAAVADITRVVSKLHNISARAMNSFGSMPYQHIVNESAEFPTYEASRVSDSNGWSFWHEVPDHSMVECLRFYNIGLELVEPGGTLTSKWDSKFSAAAVLGKHTHLVL